MYNLVGMLITFGALVLLIFYQHWLLGRLNKRLLAHVDLASWLADQAGFASSDRTAVWVATDPVCDYSYLYTKKPEAGIDVSGKLQFYYSLNASDTVYLPKKLVPEGECAKFYLIQVR